MITVTQNAISEAKRLLEKQGKPGFGLRVGVQGGGCSGLSYKLGFDQERPGDHVREIEGVKVLVDPKSDLYLEATMLDFVDGLEGRGFKFSNPQAKKTCGCGESFSV
ncbi:MAG: heme biosynthesis protein HemY [Omnitrophica bacterium RIFCSPHIGHO2_02_FULL_46_11]|nr:MAG: heme biosynthesis protein HemY [Omnitrophica bacterium RIFCSPHIGHO2_02_FULL_46_11]OGW87279.1 MAG: heme biosynthesis protein HemY [Omnitrophica bacterium RIFCSPLOWO2_01_FULL_45_10b]